MAMAMPRMPSSSGMRPLKSMPGLGSGIDLKPRRNIQDTVPVIVSVLVGAGGDDHFGEAVPCVEILAVVVEADLPGVRAWA